MESLDCVTNSDLCPYTDDWDEPHARIMTKEGSVVTLGERFYPSTDDEWDHIFTATDLVESAVSFIPLPDLEVLENISLHTLREQNDALHVTITGDLEQLQWHLISSTAACEGNDEALIRSVPIEKVDNLENCQAACVVLFDSICSTPRTVWHGASSYHLQRGNGIYSKLVFILNGSPEGGV
eukprot:CAMPEP_0206320440 /NCGR_PEP_ID=MMETSP0106_2-20121207/18322_1 /ASSEMBLY_ACC=CAM_ASM_000206 /TAXON_ID=81532 /ORGANISM="Acanthoeca-like sp., Strain 10tr" /LENGTH=181 /DNA_ID=CAMNT_0053752403 /DNA_START=259 /DNA_END=800 /DNA_ORIENTATION=+